ncbi:crotonobetainyl-CoA:carnitine CoA-transferase [Shigella sonnei]|nr:crotonobetainyl-CoA:carnitine CoA-transferase [Shigella sonnei]
MPKFKNNPGQIWRGMPSHGMDTAAILKNIGYSENDIQELVSKVRCTGNSGHYHLFFF